MNEIEIDIQTKFDDYFVDPSETTATVEDVLKPKKFYDYDGNLVEGEIETYNESNEIIPEKTDVEINTNNKYMKDNLIVKGVTSNIDENIKSSNIKKGTSILGVEGVFPFKTTIISENGEYDLSEFSIVQIQVGDKILDIQLPDELQKSTAVDVIKINSNKVLFSNKSTNNIGLWLYNVENMTWTRVSDYGYAYTTGYQLNENQWIIGGAYGSYALLYDSVTDECNSFGRLPSSLRYVTKINENIYMLSGTNSYLCVLNISTMQLTNFSSVVGSSNTFTQSIYLSENKYLIAGRNFIGLYDSNLNTLVKIETGESSFEVRLLLKVSGIKALIITSKGSTCVMTYDISNSSLNIVYTTTLSNIYYSKFHKITENKYLIYSNSTFTPGILLYNNITNTCVQIYNSGYSYDGILQVSEDSFLIYGYGGLLRYYLNDDSILAIDTSRREHVFHLVDTIYLVGSDSIDPKTLRYDSSDNSTIVIYSPQFGATNAQKISNTKMLLASNISSQKRGILLYDETTKRATSKFSGECFDTFILDGGNNYFIEYSDKSINPNIVYYDNTTETVVVKKIILEL